MRTVVADELECNFPLPRKCPRLARLCISSPYSRMMLSLSSSGNLVHAFSSKQHMSIYCMFPPFDWCLARRGEHGAGVAFLLTLMMSAEAENILSLFLYASPPLSGSLSTR